MRYNTMSEVSARGREGAGEVQSTRSRSSSLATVIDIRTDSDDQNERDYWGIALSRLDWKKQGRIKRALAEQRETLGSNERVDNRSIAWPEVIAELCRQREEEHRGKKWKVRFAGHDVNLRKTLKSWVKFFNNVKLIGDVVVNVDPLHAGLPWAAIRLIITTITPSSEQNGAIYAGIENILFIMNCGAAYEVSLAALYDSLPSDVLRNFERSLVNLYEHLLKFLGSALAFQEKNVLRRAFSALWTVQDATSFSEGCLKLEQKLDTESKLLESHRNKEVAEKIDAILKSSDYLEQKITDSTDTQSLIDALRVELKEEMENQEALNWVSSIPVLDHHINAKEGRAAETGQWVFGKHEFSKWEKSQAPCLLWIHGIPGAGKTKLATSIVDHFLPQQPQVDTAGLHPRHESDDDARRGAGEQRSPTADSTPTSKRAFAYFYCRRAEAERRKPENILRSFLKQLALSKGKSLATLRTKYMEKKRQGFLSNSLSLTECQELLIKMISQYSKTILILDALDECEEDSRYNFMEVLSRLVEQNLPVRIIISSRPDDDISAEFRDGTNFKLSATDNSHDIMTFVHGKIEEFQLAALHIAHLLSLDRPSDIEKALPNLPKSLEKTYSEIFDRITSPDNSLRDIAIRTFHWLLARDGNADVEQLLAIVCQDLENDGISPVDIDPETILKACQNLVVQEGEYILHDDSPPSFPGGRRPWSPSRGPGGPPIIGKLSSKPPPPPANWPSELPGQPLSLRADPPPPPPPPPLRANSPPSPGHNWPGGPLSYPRPPSSAVPLPPSPPNQSNPDWDHPHSNRHGHHFGHGRPGGSPGWQQATGIPRFRRPQEPFNARPKFRFAHLSVQEYCETIQWTQNAAHNFAAKICLLVLLQPEKQFTFSKVSPHAYGLHPVLPVILRDLADSIWIYHIQRCCNLEVESQDCRLVALAARFLGFPDETSAAFERWLSRLSWTEHPHPGIRPAF
ncbi:hypothetical protein N431DRAFT_479659 [Stipitochalara longipes BDJ]|nr:hypothetical protein N431DRAFT_479659 [Stipitochalara longipes BDJ]